VIQGLPVFTSEFSPTLGPLFKKVCTVGYKKEKEGFWKAFISFASLFAPAFFLCQPICSVLHSHNLPLWTKFWHIFLRE